MKKYMPYLVVIVILLLIVIAECIMQLAHGKYNVMESAAKELEYYCMRKEISQADFLIPRIYYPDEIADFCIEYMTKENVKPRHVVLIFFEQGNVSEIHSLED